MAPKVKVKVIVGSVVSDSLWPLDCSPPGSSVHRILSTRILDWVAIPICRGSSWPRDWSRVSCIAGRFVTIWATREVPGLILKKTTKNVAWGMYWWLTLASRAAPKAGRRGDSHPRQRDWGAPERSGCWEGCGSHAVWERTGMSHVFGLPSTLGCLPWSCSP